MPNVKAGFHHDLNAIATDEQRGPTFPCTYELHVLSEYEMMH